MTRVDSCVQSRLDAGIRRQYYYDMVRAVGCGYLLAKASRNIYLRDA